MTSTSFWARVPRIIRSLPPCTRRAMCPTWLPWSSDADWCLRSDVVSNLGLQGPDVSYLDLVTAEFTEENRQQLERESNASIRRGQVAVCCVEGLPEGGGLCFSASPATSVPPPIVLLSYARTPTMLPMPTTIPPTPAPP